MADSKEAEAGKQKTPAQLKKEAEKAAKQAEKLAKFKAKQEKLAEQKAQAEAKPKEVRFSYLFNFSYMNFSPRKRMTSLKLSQNTLSLQNLETGKTRPVNCRLHTVLSM